METRKICFHVKSGKLKVHPPETVHKISEELTWMNQIQKYPDQVGEGRPSPEGLVVGVTFAENLTHLRGYDHADEVIFGGKLHVHFCGH